MTPGWKIKKYHLSGCQWQNFLPRCLLLWSRIYHRHLDLWPELLQPGCWGLHPQKRMFDICKEELKFRESENTYLVEVNNRNPQTKRLEIWIIYTVQGIEKLIRLMVVAFTCHYDLTCPLSWPDQRQMIMSTGMLKPLNKWCFHIPCPLWAIWSTAF